MLERAEKRYRDLVALAPLSLTIRSGERVALMGPSGGGKSTLLGLLAASLHPDHGRVTIAGQPTTTLRPGRDLARLVGVMPQGVALVPSLAVVHNVLAGRLGEWGLVRSLASLLVPREIDAVHAALDRVGIAEKLWQRTDRLSGGEHQRVALARLLIQHPRAVLADEPVSAVDPARAEDLIALMVALAAEQGQTLIASLHAVPLGLRYFDRIIALRGGRLVFDRPAAAVTPAHLAALYDLRPEPTRVAG